MISDDIRAFMLALDITTASEPHRFGFLRFKRKCFRFIQLFEDRTVSWKRLRDMAIELLRIIDDRHFELTVPNSIKSNLWDYTLATFKDILKFATRIIMPAPDPTLVGSFTLAQRLTNMDVFQQIDDLLLPAVVVNHELNNQQRGNIKYIANSAEFNHCLAEFYDHVETFHMLSWKVELDLMTKEPVMLVLGTIAGYTLILDLESFMFTPKNGKPEINLPIELHQILIDPGVLVVADRVEDEFGDILGLNIHRPLNMIDTSQVLEYLRSHNANFYDPNPKETSTTYLNFIITGTSHEPYAKHSKLLRLRQKLYGLCSCPSGNSSNFFQAYSPLQIYNWKHPVSDLQERYLYSEAITPPIALIFMMKVAIRHGLFTLPLWSSFSPAILKFGLGLKTADFCSIF
jgi:hypothetical protein